MTKTYFINQDGVLKNLSDMPFEAYNVQGDTVDVLSEDGYVNDTFVLHTLEQAQKFLGSSMTQPQVNQFIKVVKAQNPYGKTRSTICKG